MQFHTNCIKSCVGSQTPSDDRQAEPFLCLRRGQLGIVVQMCVDVGCCGEVAVPQPLLNLLHRHAARQHHARAAVPEIVKSDGTQPFALQQLVHRIDADVADVVRAVAPSAQSPVFRLLLL